MDHVEINIKADDLNQSFYVEAIRFDHKNNIIGVTRKTATAIDLIRLILAQYYLENHIKVEDKWLAIFCENCGDAVDISVGYIIVGTKVYGISCGCVKMHDGKPVIQLKE